MKKCSNCGKPNLISRRNKAQDVFCGWCGTEYRIESRGLVLVAIHNNHHTERVKEKLQREQRSEIERLRRARLRNAEKITV